jgi:hypothetical protein
MEETTRTVVSSVLFLDIVGYSKMGVGDQLKLKHAFNSVLLVALEQVDPSERIVVDTGDGAAVAIMGNPERALFVAISIFDNSGLIQVRGGVNLGPISLMKDINGQANVIGDGINVAQRIMGFAKEGELLVSRSFHEVVTRLSAEYAAIFSNEGTRTDKHERKHEVYAVQQSVRVGRKMAELTSRLTTQRASTRPGWTPPTTKATISDAGSQLMISGYTEASVQEALDQLEKQGRTLMAPISKIGSKWFASVDKPEAAGASVEQYGLRQMISGPTREAVEIKVRELQEYGAQLVQEIEQIDGVWTAVCEKS